MNKSDLENKVKELDWDFVGADTQYLTHNIHRYSGKFIPQIAKQVIGLLTNPGDLILDPYCGSGTVLLESSLNGRRSVGIDANPLAVLISKVKTKPMKKGVLETFLSSMEARVSPILKQPQLRLPFQFQVDLENTIEKIHQNPRWTDPWYQKWFEDEVRSELIYMHNQIMQEDNEDCKNIALVAFSDILRKCSNANPSYPNVMYDKNRGIPPSAAPEFVRRLRQVVQMVSELEESLASRPVAKVYQGNARHLTLEGGTIDAVVTHPPYIGSIPYAEYGLLSLMWLDFNPRDVDKGLTGGRRQSKNVVEKYKAEFLEMFGEVFRVLKPGGKLFMLLGNPVVKGKQIDLKEMAKNLAYDVGFHLLATHVRNGMNRRASLMNQEYLLFFRKN